MKNHSDRKSDTVQLGASPQEDKGLKMASPQEDERFTEASF